MSLTVQSVYTARPEFKENPRGSIHVSLVPFEGCAAIKAVRLDSETDKVFMDRIRVEINKLYASYVKEDANGVLMAFLTNKAVLRGNGTYEFVNKELIYMKTGCARTIRFNVSEILGIQQPDISHRFSATNTAKMVDGILVPIDIYDENVRYYDIYTNANTTDIEFEIATADIGASAILNAMINRYRIPHLDGCMRVPTLLGLQSYLNDMLDMGIHSVTFTLNFEP
jgi:hypothetical protein